MPVWLSGAYCIFLALSWAHRMTFGYLLFFSDPFACLLIFLAFSLLKFMKCPSFVKQLLIYRGKVLGKWKLSSYSNIHWFKVTEPLFRLHLCSPAPTKLPFIFLSYVQDRWSRNVSHKQQTCLPQYLSHYLWGFSQLRTHKIMVK